MKPKEHELKDKILKHLIENPKIDNISEISNHLKIDYYSACYILKRLFL